MCRANCIDVKTLKQKSARLILSGEARPQIIDFKKSNENNKPTSTPMKILFVGSFFSFFGLVSVILLLLLLLASCAPPCYRNRRRMVVRLSHLFSPWLSATGPCTRRARGHTRDTHIKDHHFPHGENAAPLHAPPQHQPNHPTRSLCAPARPPTFPTRLPTP